MIKKTILIIGAGPIGLAMALSLIGNGFKIIIVELQSKKNITTPIYDGREIALTHRSKKIMDKLRIWELINPESISRINKARILDNDDQPSIELRDYFKKNLAIGYLISNKSIKSASYKALHNLSLINNEIQFIFDTEVLDIEDLEGSSRVKLSSGQFLKVSLVISADSRFSKIRTLKGIQSSSYNYGRDMLVCNMTHEKSHELTAWEWFTYGQTLALLPMQNCKNGLYKSSVIITATKHEINYLRNLEPDVFSLEVSKKFKKRFGSMKLDSDCYIYPLVSVYSNKFVGKNYAVIGDAAVGMHPVTAHGYNFGLESVTTLSQLIKDAHEAGKDFASEILLKKYEQIHVRTTKPLYLFTKFIANLFTSESRAAMVIRKIIIRAARLPLVERAASKIILRE